jgi:hypothetical protein
MSNLDSYDAERYHAWCEGFEEGKRCQLVIDRPDLPSFSVFLDRETCLDVTRLLAASLWVETDLSLWVAGACAASERWDFELRKRV